MTLPLAGEGFEMGDAVEEFVLSISFDFVDPLLSWEAVLSRRFLVLGPEEKPVGSPPMLRGLASPPGGGDLIRPPMLTSCLGPLGVELRERSGLALCFALLISDIQAGC